MHSVIASAFIGSSGSRLLIALLTAAAVGLLVVAITVLLGRSQAKVERQLAGYELPDGTEAGPSGSTGGMTQPETAVVQQAMAFTSRMAVRTGLMARTEMMLEQADLPLRARRAAVLRARLRDHRVPALRGHRRTGRRPRRRCDRPARAVLLSQLPARARGASASSDSCPTRSRSSPARCAPASH